MVAKILSLLNPLKKTFWSRLLKCVSPLLMGAVLAIGVMEPLEVCAAVGAFSFRAFNEADPIHSESGGTVTLSETYRPSQITIDSVNVNSLGQYDYYYTMFFDIDVPVSIYGILGGDSGYWDLRYTFSYTPSYDFTYEDKGFYYRIINESNIRVNVDNIEQVNFRITGAGQNRLTEEISNRYYLSATSTANSYISNYNINFKFQVSGMARDHYPTGYVTLKLNNASIKLDYSKLVSSGNIPQLIKEVDESIDEGNQAAADRWEEDRSDAEEAGSDMTGFASQLDNLKNTWAILWYPIEFTNRFVEVFTGGTQAAAYQDEYTYVTGYRYNDETGFLDPIMARSAQPQSAGTGITFPSFELMGYTVWDSYTYDLSQVKQQLPEVFDAIYVIVSILEMLWFVGFLRSKYNEVFG